jgi:hypothetical protein
LWLVTVLLLMEGLRLARYCVKLNAPPEAG